jgi:hypothetical protein
MIDMTYLSATRKRVTVKLVLDMCNEAERLDRLFMVFDDNPYIVLASEFADPKINVDIPSFDPYQPIYAEMWLEAYATDVEEWLTTNYPEPITQPERLNKK